MIKFGSAMWHGDRAISIQREMGGLFGTVEIGLCIVLSDNFKEQPYEISKRALKHTFKIFGGSDSHREEAVRCLLTNGQCDIVFNVPRK